MIVRASASSRFPGLPSGSANWPPTFADTDRQLAAVVDVNPRKWGRYLPVTAHRVDSPETLTRLRPEAVIITNPSYRTEIAEELRRLGIEAELLIA